MNRNRRVISKILRIICKMIFFFGGKFKIFRCNLLLFFMLRLFATTYLFVCGINGLISHICRIKNMIIFHLFIKIEASFYWLSMASPYTLSTYYTTYILYFMGVSRINNFFIWRYLSLSLSLRCFLYLPFFLLSFHERVRERESVAKCTLHN